MPRLPDLVVGCAIAEPEQPRGPGGVHAVGDGEQHGRRRGGGHDPALLPVDGRDGYGVGHRGGTQAVPRLPASAGIARPTSLTAPETAGTYYYAACVDAVTDESDTTNNCSTAVQVTVTQPQPQPPAEPQRQAAPI